MLLDIMNVGIALDISSSKDLQEITLDLTETLEDNNLKSKTGFVWATRLVDSLRILGRLDEAQRLLDRALVAVLPQTPGDEPFVE
jgi:hypothetical protein